MTVMNLLAVGANGAPTRLDPVQLFLEADIVVQAVMVGLLLASIWTWMIILSFSLRMNRLNAKGRHYETDFWGASDVEKHLRSEDRKAVPAARVAASGYGEWRRSTAKGVSDKDGARQRIAGAMDGQVAVEADELADRLNFLATTGSVAPFVGLFGTVWGIMNSFFQIGQQNSSSLAVVAPGISEALFATAIGLFAAIPAVIAYNRFSHAVNSHEARLQRFADRFHASLSRELDTL
ncbi:Protein TolQ [Alteripontixanthobacter maritimus]|uniref:Protein TolQ n=1 Tax=Alteripontixanthobacter maritimus TaxID=2161824 RepID=A0A369Q719_9SPHN|nr:protein TolQ [Alteripontixanthobacter maritimus]RDC60653.1 Protein TolQ [Alteripontixanthobacter maritimus]